MAGALPRTKIVATIGPSSDVPETLERMIRAGMTVARLNFAHGGRADHERRVELVRRTAHRAGRDIAVLGDLAGPKLRIGELKGGRATLEPGRRVVLTARAV